MKNKKLMIGLVGILLIILFSNIMSTSDLQNNSPKTSQGDVNSDNLINVDFPVYINGNWSAYVEKYDWCSGNGTEEDPYIIEGIYINNPEQTARISIETAKHFIIRNCIFYNYSDPCSGYTDAALYIEKLEYGLIENNTFINCSRGISLYKAKDDVKIINNRFIGSHDDPDTGMGCAIKILEAKGINISYNDIYNYYDGIIVRDAEEVFIENNRIETSFGYISQTGIYFYGVNDSSIINNDFYNCNFTGHEYDVIMSSEIDGLKLSKDTLINCFNITIYGNRFYDLDGNLIVDESDDKPDNIIFIISGVVSVSIIIVAVVIVVNKRRKK